MACQVVCESGKATQPTTASQPSQELRWFHLCILQNFVQSSGADGLAGMNRHHCPPPVGVLHKMVAALDAQNAETCAPQDRDNLPPA